MFDKSVSLDNTNVKFMRTMLSLGAPLNINGVRYTDKNDRAGEQNDFAEQFIFEIDQKIKDEIGDASLKAELIARFIQQKDF